MSKGHPFNKKMKSSSGWGSKPFIALAVVVCLYLFFTYGNRGGNARPLPINNGKKHVLVTGGAGFIGSHASLKLLEEGYSVTAIDNFSRGNPGAITAVKDLAKKMGKQNFYNFVELDLGSKDDVCSTLRQSQVNLVIHFAAIAYVGESVAEPLRYYHNITSNTVTMLECMHENNIKNLVYSSTCATYGNVQKLPITEETPPVPINPYGKSKLMAENAIRDYAYANDDFNAIIFRYFNVYGSDPKGRLGEYPPPDLRQHGRISGACMDAALGEIEHLTILGTDHPTEDGTCVRDYIHVTDLVEAHVKGIDHMQNPPSLFNIGTGNGVSVREFVEACKSVTGKDIDVIEQKESRPGDYAAVYSDVTKINKEMGWKAQYTDVSEGLKHAWEWRSKHPYGYTT